MYDEKKRNQRFICDAPVDGAKLQCRMRAIGSSKSIEKVASVSNPERAVGRLTVCCRQLQMVGLYATDMTQELLSTKITRIMRKQWAEKCQFSRCMAASWPYWEAKHTEMCRYVRCSVMIPPSLSCACTKICNRRQSLRPTTAKHFIRPSSVESHPASVHHAKHLPLYSVYSPIPSVCSMQRGIQDTPYVVKDDIDTHTPEYVLQIADVTFLLPFI